jgi:hypothetical protein
MGVNGSWQPLHTLMRPLLTAAPRAEAPAALPPAITLTDNSLLQLKKLKAESKGEQLVLRIGVKSGGCSGMRRVAPPCYCTARDAAPAAARTRAGAAALDSCTALRRARFTAQRAALHACSDAACLLLRARTAAM